MRLMSLPLALTLPATADPLADIVILDEVHDNADAHFGQAVALRDLRPTATAFEMLTAEEAMPFNEIRIVPPTERGDPCQSLTSN